MANLPGIIIKIGANTKGAIDGLNRVNAALGKSQTRSDRMHAAVRRLGPAFGIAAGAAGAMAVALGTQAVQAAMAEESELAKLNTTLRNLGFTGASAQVSKFIDDLQFTTGVTDSELRPAFDRLIRSTGSVASAQSALQVALDTSVGTGRSLQAVAEALGKAYDGNTTGLSRLGAGISKATLKTGDMNLIMGTLAKTFSGQAATAADTLQGRMKILAIGVDELQESFGKGLIDGFVSSMSGTGDTLEKTAQTLRDLQGDIENIGNTFGSVGAISIKALSTVIDMVKAVAIQAAYAAEHISIEFGRSWLDLMDKMGVVGDEEADLERQHYALRDAANKAAYDEAILALHIGDTGTAAEKTASATNRLVTAGESDLTTMEKRTRAADLLKASLDKLSGRRNIMEQKFRIAGLLESGPAKSGRRKGADGKITEFSTVRDRKDLAFIVADQYTSLADSYKKGSKKRSTLADAREAIRGMNLPSAFEKNLLSTLTPERVTRVRPGTPQSGREVAAVNIQTMNVNVPSVAEAIEQARKAARLQGLGRGQTANAMRYSGMAAAS